MMKVKFGSISIGRLIQLRDFLEERNFKCWFDGYTQDLIVKIKRKNEDLLSKTFKEFENITL